MLPACPGRAYEKCEAFCDWNPSSGRGRGSYSGLCAKAEVGCTSTHLREGKIPRDGYAGMRMNRGLRKEGHNSEYTNREKLGITVTVLRRRFP
jgi:hypothetical protein